jgi:Apolipoprotein N-acyltransferase
VNKPDQINFRKYFLCLIAGAALTLAFSPFDYAWLGILSPAVLFYYWRRSVPGSAFISGYLFGLGMFGTGVNWLHISIDKFGGISLAGALFITFLLVAYLALFPALAGYLGRKYFKNNMLWLVR